MLAARVVTLSKPGKGKDSTTPANFHPISLLNLDIKIYAKLLAKCLLDILLHLIKSNQLGFTNGRQASDATRRIIDVIYHAEMSQTPSMLLSIDAACQQYCPSLVLEALFSQQFWHFTPHPLPMCSHQEYSLNNFKFPVVHIRSAPFPHQYLTS